MIGGRRRVFLKVYQSGRPCGHGHKSFSFRAKHKLPLTFHLDVTLDLMEDREIQLNKQVIADRGRGVSQPLTHFVFYPLCAIFGNTVSPFRGESRSAVAAIWV